MGKEDEKNDFYITQTISVEEKRVPQMERKKDLVPEEIPKEKNNPIDDIKKRRSSLRRSINGGSGATFLGK